MTYTQIRNKYVLIDSNVIIYSSNTLSSKYEQAVDFRNAGIAGYFRPVISYQNILESMRVLTHTVYNNPMTSKEAMEHIHSFRSFCSVIYPLSETLEVYFRLMEKYALTGNAIFDTYLVATMLSNDIHFIATDNVKDFGRFEEIAVCNPFQ